MANCGDSKAVLLRASADKDSNELTAVNVSKTFNANKDYEQARLKKQFSRESDIVICKGSGACYVKGGLMPTRAIGDFRLKKKDINFHEMGSEYGFRKPIPTFTGPYISAEPDIQVINLTKDDKYIVLATDGLWDEIKRKDSGKIATKLLTDGTDNTRISKKPYTFQLCYTLCMEAQ